MAGLRSSLKTAHFWANLILSFLFVAVKATPLFRSTIWDGDPRVEPGLDEREYEILLFLSCIVAFKCKKDATTEAMLSTAFTLCKVANVYLFGRINVGAAVIYLVLWVLAFVLAPEPAYSCPSNIKALNTAKLNELRLVHKQQGTPTTPKYIVAEFFATWSPPCQHLAPELAEVSLRHQHKDLQFVKIDVGRWTAAGKEFKLDLNAASAQIPTIILFKNGDEVMRRPEVDLETKKVHKCVFTGRYVESEFKLDERLKEVNGAAVPTGRSQGKKQQ